MNRIPDRRPDDRGPLPALWRVLAAPALAHETAAAGALALEVGWGTEPAYVGQLNTVQLIVTHEADGDPINDPGARLTAMVTYGDQEQEFALTPTYDAGRPAPGRRASTRRSSSRPRPATTRSTSPARWRASRWISKVTSSPKTFSPVEDASAVQFPVKVPGDRPGGAAARQGAAASSRPPPR